MRVVALDITRFIAALSVVLYHYISRPSSDAYPVISKITDYDYLGVTLFFIISGYVIALSADNRSAFQFGVSRFVRLYPTLWAGIAFTTITTIILSTDKKYTLLQVLSNLTQLNDYMGFSDIDEVYWTLKAELKFYACIFLLLLFGVFKYYHIWLSVWLVLTTLHTITGQPFFMGWFIKPAYSSFFIAGIACFLIQKYGKTPFNLFIFLSSLVISSFKAFEQTNGFMTDPRLVEKSMSVAIVWCFYLFFYCLCTGKINFPERKLFFTIGALTYPLYLIHNVAGKAIIDKYSNFMSEDLVILIAIVLMIFVSLFIHKKIEKPLASSMKDYLLSSLEK